MSSLTSVMKRISKKDSKKGPEFTSQEAYEILRLIIDVFIPMENVRHRDIKVEDILLGKGKLKIGDFGLAKFIKGPEKKGKSLMSMIRNKIFSNLNSNK